MSKYAWITDVHLDFLGEDNNKLIQFGESLVRDNPTGIFITGDISVAKKVTFHLSAIEKIVKRPIYFILGNHDYYGSSIENVRKQMREVTNISPFLRYMQTMPYYSLGATTAVVGHDGWYDANWGDWKGSTMKILDWTAIKEFTLVNGSKQTIVTEARKLAQEGAMHIHNGIKQAVRYHKTIVVLTHFPPFPQSHMHEGKVGEPGAMPWFVSKMMGDMLMDASKAFPTHKFIVLCGHTHGKWDGQITNNLEVHVGGADYYKPALQGLIEVP
jgi:3',5'-cyclic-AMP phosphodiesterase